MLEDLRGQTLFGLPPSVNATVSGLRRLSECIGSIGDGSITTIISDDHHYCLSMAEENCGMTLAPVFPSTLRNTETLVYKPFRDPELLLDIHIVWKTDPLSATAQSLVNIAQDYFSGSWRYCSSIFILTASDAFCIITYYINRKNAEIREVKSRWHS